MLTVDIHLTIFIKVSSVALKKILQDVKTLRTGGKVELILNVIQAIQFNYREYLRIILLMNPGGEKRLLRVVALAEHRLSSSLLDQSTYASAEIESDYGLSQGFPKCLNEIGVLEGRVEDNRFIFKTKFNIPY